ncbi:MAG: Hpt domain-containing protein [Chitinophagaceae bacterium]
MTSNTFSNTFIFNKRFDNDYLFSLYAGEYSYIEEIFATTLEYFDEDVEKAAMAYATGNMSDLKNALHKLKPTFGFVGLLTIQDECRDFELKCQRTDDVEELKQDYKQIVITLAEGKELIEKEYRRLKDFNANPI